MRRLVYYVAVSLDGRIAGPDHEVDAFPFSPALADHIVEHFPETLPAPVRSQLGIDDRPNQRFDAVVMGRHTYDLGRREGLTSPYPHLDQTVVSTTLPPGDTPHIVRDASAVDRLLEGDGRDVWLCGGGTLAGALADRVDELVLKRAPINLGAGRALFTGNYHPRPFELRERLELEGSTIETWVRAE
jgi:dihydrofolate reductase